MKEMSKLIVGKIESKAEFFVSFDDFIFQFFRNVRWNMDRV